LATYRKYADIVSVDIQTFLHEVGGLVDSSLALNRDMIKALSELDRPLSADELLHAVLFYKPLTMKEEIDKLYLYHVDELSTKVKLLFRPQNLSYPS
jgi:hypothetical protein